VICSAEVVEAGLGKTETKQLDTLEDFNINGRHGS